MAALHPPATARTVADVDVELAVDRLAGDLGLVLLLDVGLLERPAAVGTGLGQRGLVDLVDLRRWRPARLGTVVGARLAAGLFGLCVRRALGEGGGLAFAGAEGLGELRFEFGDAPSQGFTGGADGVHTDSIGGTKRTSCASLPPETLNNYLK
jgi:hypothetical protein